MHYKNTKQATKFQTREILSLYNALRNKQTVLMEAFE